MELQAGRELDAQIAEQIMGYTVARGTAVYDDMVMPFMTYHTPDGRILNPIPYSSDLAAASHVATALYEQGGWRLAIDDGPDGAPRIWRVEFTRRGKSGRGASDHLALAICRAALAAVGATE